MHEMSIALAILEIAQEQAEAHGAQQVEAVHLKLGALSGVVKQALLHAFELAQQEAGLGPCRLLIEDVPVRLHCSRCATERAAASPQELCCCVCGTPGEIVSGRELQVVAMEINS